MKKSYLITNTTENKLPIINISKKLTDNYVQRQVK